MWADLPSNNVNDFDFALIDPYDETVAYSSNAQSLKKDAFEWISYVPEVEGTYHIGITYSGSSTPSDLLEIFIMVCKNKLSEIEIKWNNYKSLCIVLCSKGYPEKYNKNIEIKYLDKIILSNNDYVYHAGTITKKNKILSNGG